MTDSCLVLLLVTVSVGRLRVGHVCVDTELNSMNTEVWRGLTWQRGDTDRLAARARKPQLAELQARDVGYSQG